MGVDCIVQRRATLSIQRPVPNVTAATPQSHMIISFLDVPPLLASEKRDSGAG
jgi:hypothetical protein